MIFIFFSRHTISNTTISYLFNSLTTVSMDFEVLMMFMRFFMLFLLFSYLFLDLCSLYYLIYKKSYCLCFQTFLSCSAFFALL